MNDRPDEPRSPFSPPPTPQVIEPDWNTATRAIVAGRPARRPDSALNEPVAFASTYHAGGPVAYGRDGNPTWSALEEVIGTLEGGTAVSFASGMAAVAAVFEQVAVGGVIVLPRDGYYGTRAFLDAMVPGRWSIRFVDIWDTEATVAACEGAELLWIESPTNPKLDVADIPTLCEAARALGVLVAVDNTYMTPLGQRPLDLGAHLVVHSVSKLLAGHADVVLGAAVTARGSDLCTRSAPTTVNGRCDPRADGGLSRPAWHPHIAPTLSPSTGKRRGARPPPRSPSGGRTCPLSGPGQPTPGTIEPEPRWTASAT